MAPLRGGRGHSFRANEKNQKIAQGTTFLENPPSLRGLLIALRPSDFWSIVRALSRCQCLLLRTFLSELLVASRHSARKSGGEGANQKNVPLERVPLAPQYPFGRPTGGVLHVPERQKKNLSFTWHRNSSFYPNVRKPLAEVGRRTGGPEKGILKPQV